MIYNDFCGPGLELKMFTPTLGPKKKIEESTSQICLSAHAPPPTTEKAMLVFLSSDSANLF
jgi:hypothetical protein